MTSQCLFFFISEVMDGLIDYLLVRRFFSGKEIKKLHIKILFYNPIHKGVLLGSRKSKGQFVLTFKSLGTNISCDGPLCILLPII